MKLSEQAERFLKENNIDMSTVVNITPEVCDEERIMYKDSETGVIMKKVFKKSIVDDTPILKFDDTISEREKNIYLRIRNV